MDADVVIDFSMPDGLVAASKACRERGVALVAATTGLSDEQKAIVHEAAKSVPVVFAPSMSLAVNIAMKIVGDAARALKEAGAVIVGVDTYNIDDTTDMRRPVHTTLLGANIPIVEHMCDLEYIPDSRAFKFFAVPVKVKNFGTFPVRAFAMLA